LLPLRRYPLWRDIILHTDRLADGGRPL